MQAATAANLSELKTRLNIHLKDIISFFVEGKVQQSSVDLMNKFIEEELLNDFMELTEGYGRSMAFLNQAEHVENLKKAYGLMVDCWVMEKVIVGKRLIKLKEDNGGDLQQLLYYMNIDRII